MLELTVNLDERSYPIYIGQSALQQTDKLRHHIGDCRPIIITNDTIAPLYLSDAMALLADLNPLSFIIPDGEQYKSLEWFEKISAFLLENNCNYIQGYYYSKPMPANEMENYMKKTF